MPTLAEMPEFAALDESTRGHVVALGFDKLDPLQAAITASGKLAAFGSNPDDLIRLPKDATGDALAPLYDRLGVPKDAAGYVAPEGTDATLAAKVQQEAAALKLTPAAFNQLLELRKADGASAASARAEQQLAAVTAAKGELIAAWGPEQGVKEFRASKALETFGWTVTDVATMAGTNKDAYVKIMQNMAVLGERMAEAKLLGGPTGDGGSGAMTPEQAQAKMTALQVRARLLPCWSKSPPPVSK